MLLTELRPKIQQLLLLRDAKADYQVTEADLQAGEWLAGAPPSWAQGRRVIQPVSSVQLVWNLDVSELRDAARCSAADKGGSNVCSTQVSPPLGGIGFVVSANCIKSTAGVKIGLYCHVSDLWSGLVCVCDFEIEVVGFMKSTGLSRLPFRDGLGWDDFFELGHMPGGWDDVAWAGKGLPTSGQLTIKLTVSKVSHATGV
jgi:hypothetical protein